MRLKRHPVGVYSACGVGLLTQCVLLNLFHFIILLENARLLNGKGSRSGQSHISVPAPAAPRPSSGSEGHGGGGGGGSGDGSDDETQKVYDSVPRTEDVFNLNRADLGMMERLGKSWFICLKFY